MRILIIALTFLILLVACGEKADWEKTTEERLSERSNLSKVVEISEKEKPIFYKSGWTMWQIAEIIKRIESLESEIKELDRDDIQLQEQIKKLEKEIGNLHRRISDACDLIDDTGKTMRYFQSEFSNYGMIPRTCF